MNCQEIIEDLSSGGAEKTTKLSRFRVLKKTLFVLRSIKIGEITEKYLVPYIPDKLMPGAFRTVHEETSAGHKGYERTMRNFVKKLL